MAAVLAVLVRSLAAPNRPGATTTQATDAATVQSGDKADSIRNPRICVPSPTASMRAIP